MMRVVYSDMQLCDESDFSKSIFLAGPTPRSNENKSWRIDALSILTEIGYTGTVFVPERRDWSTLSSYEHQVEWEDAAISYCRCLTFWVPRDMKTMPALTTNVEFGRWIMKKPLSVVYGRPENAQNCRYLDWLFKKETGQTPENTIYNTLLRASKL